MIPGHFENALRKPYNPVSYKVRKMECLKGYTLSDTIYFHETLVRVKVRVRVWFLGGGLMFG